MHDFKASLAQEKVLAEKTKALREAAYTDAFPGLHLIGPDVVDLALQRSGVDRVLTLSSGKELLIQEKFRTVDYGDIALEYESGVRPGWIEENLVCDYLAYIIVPERVELFPFLTLQAAWKKNKQTWLETYGTKTAQNPHYSTKCCPVPAEVIWAAMRQASRTVGIPKNVSVTPAVESAGDRYYADLGIEEPARPKPCIIENEFTGWND